MSSGYRFEALRTKILFTQGAHKHKQSRPKLERMRIAQPAYGLPDEAMGYALPIMICREITRAPKPLDQHEPLGPQKNYGADTNTLIQLLAVGRL